LAILFASPCIGYAQGHAVDIYFKVYVTDIDRHPVDGVVFGRRGQIFLSESTDQGLTKIRITIGINGRPPGRVELVLVDHVPENENWEMLNHNIPVCDLKDPEAYSDVYLKRKPVSKDSQQRIGNTNRERVVTSALELGKLMYVDGKYQKAIDILKVALEHDPENHTVLHHLGKALTQIDAYGEALDVFNKCVRIRENPQLATPIELAETLKEFANLLTRMGQLAEAEKNQKRADSILLKSGLLTQQN